MITKDDIATYRATYPREHLDQKAKEQNLHCGTPLGSVLAVNALCDAYEEIEKQRDALLTASEIFMSHGVCEISYYAIRDAIAIAKGNAA